MIYYEILNYYMKYFIYILCKIFLSIFFIFIQRITFFLVKHESIFVSQIFFEDINNCTNECILFTFPMTSN